MSVLYNTVDNQIAMPMLMLKKSSSYKISKNKTNHPISISDSKCKIENKNYISIAFRTHLWRGSINNIWIYNIGQFHSHLQLKPETTALNVKRYLRNLTSREKKKRSTQSYDKSPYYYRKILKATQQQTQPKFLITQRLRTDLGRSVGVTTTLSGVV